MRDGIDFVPLDVTLDDKFTLIEAEYGIKGFAVIVKLFQKIYGGEGYYCEWTNDIALLFSRKIGVGGNVVSQIVNSALKRGLFNAGLYKRYQILTSRGIQKRYLKAQSRKVRVEMKKAYLLIEVAQIPKNVTILTENVTEASEIVTDTNINKIKLNKTKLNEVKRMPPAPVKKKYADYVFLTEKEYITLVNEHGEADAMSMITILNDYKASSGKTYKSDYHAIRKWVVSALEEQKRKKPQSVFSDNSDYDEIEKIIRGKM